MLSDSDLGLPAAPIILGPSYATQFCPNLVCRQPFKANQLDAITQHFNGGSHCGIWLQSLQSTNHEDGCPNPTCGASFENADEHEAHLSGPNSPCSEWYRQILQGKFPAYPNVNNVDDEDQGEHNHSIPVLLYF